MKLGAPKTRIVFQGFTGVHFVCMVIVEGLYISIQSYPVQIVHLTKKQQRNRYNYVLQC